MKNPYLLLGIALLASCSQEENVSIDQGNLSGDQVTMSVPAIRMQSGPQSRTSANIIDNQTRFTWSTDDQVGIFPNAGGDQVYFSIKPDENQSSSASAIFDGGGWAVQSGCQYTAYYPFQPVFFLDKEHMSVDFSNQQQSGKNFNHVGKTDFMIAAPVNAASATNGLHFDFKHMITLCVAQITLPEIGSISDLTLAFPSEGDNHFYKTGEFSINEGNNAHITATEKSHTFTIKAQELKAEQREVPIELAFTQGAMSGITGKTCTATVNYTNEKSEQRTLNTSFVFNTDLEEGNGYYIKLVFPLIDIQNNTIIAPEAGILRAEDIANATSPGGKLTVKGKLNGSDIALLREAADPAVQPSRGTQIALTELDLREVQIVQGGTPESRENVLSAGMFDGCRSIQTFTLPNLLRKIESAALADMPQLTTLHITAQADQITIAPDFLGTSGTEGDTNPAQLTVNLTDQSWNYSENKEKLDQIKNGYENMTVVISDLNVNPDPGIDPWKPGEGGNVETE